MGSVRWEQFCHWTAIKIPRVIEWLAALRGQIDRRLLAACDGLAAHRLRQICDHLENLCGAISLERLPAYEAELNSVDYVWGCLRDHELSNFCDATSHN